MDADKISGTGRLRYLPKQVSLKNIFFKFGFEELETPVPKVYHAIKKNLQVQKYPYNIPLKRHG